MNLLVIESGKQIKEEEGSLHEVHRFYYILFNTQGRSIKATQARRELLRYMTTTISQAQWKEIERLPTDEELRAILKRMPMEKSPGLDGMQVEVLSVCWSFIDTDCMNMIKHYWSTGTMTHNFTIGVMKVVPKKIDKRNLRLFTMLTIIYKLIITILSS